MEAASTQAPKPYYYIPQPSTWPIRGSIALFLMAMGAALWFNAYAPGWGVTGPYAGRQSFAPLLSGYVGAGFEVAGQFNAPLWPVGNEDPGNGLLGTIGMLMALLYRQRHGGGQLVENPQLNASMALMATLSVGVVSWGAYAAGMIRPTQRFISIEAEKITNAAATVIREKGSVAKSLLGAN